MKTLTVRCQKLHPEASVPVRGSAHAAGWDLVAVEAVTLPAGGWASVGTGLAVEVPEGFELQVRPRSGLAARHGVTVLNAPGTVDADYRGEVRVLLINHGAEAFEVRAGERIAQAVIAAHAVVSYEVGEALGETGRGEGGFGSTGMGRRGGPEGG